MPIDALAQVGRLQARVAQEMLDVFDHRPFEEDLASLGIVAQAAFHLFACGSPPNPDVLFPGGPQRVAQPRFHVAKGAPAFQVGRRQPDDLFLAEGIVIPELHAGAVVERDEHAGRAGSQRNPYSAISSSSMTSGCSSPAR